MTISAALQLSRRAVCGVIPGMIWPFPLRATAASRAVLVYRDPNCGCCGAWAKHLASVGFSIEVAETSYLDEIRRRLGVPAELAACHTAKVEGYVCGRPCAGRRSQRRRGRRHLPSPRPGSAGRRQPKVVLSSTKPRETSLTSPGKLRRGKSY
jgi:hypothetical protein